MSVNLDSEVVATAFDPATRTCSYTIERDGKRWTVPIPLHQLEQHGNTVSGQQSRRTHLANLLEAAMRGKPDVA